VSHRAQPFTRYADDLADVFIAAAEHPKASGATFEVAWSDSEERPLAALLDGLKADAET
jgi:hypothetical protein